MTYALSCNERPLIWACDCLCMLILYSMCGQWEVLLSAWL